MKKGMYGKEEKDQRDGRDERGEEGRDKPADFTWREDESDSTMEHAEPMGPLQFAITDGLGLAIGMTTDAGEGVAFALENWNDDDMVRAGGPKALARLLGRAAGMLKS